MECNWTKEDFIEQRKKLADFFSKEQDIKKRAYIQKVMDSMDKIYHECFNYFPMPEMSIEQKLTDIINSSLSYSRYYSLVKTFFSECCCFNENIDDIDKQLEEILNDEEKMYQQTGAILSSGNILSMVERFYSSFDDDLYNYFLKIYNEREKTVKFIPLEELNEQKSNGNTIFMDIVLKNFITICNTTPIETYACAVHEYGHAIHNLINPTNSFVDREDFVAEVAAIFPEIVAIYEDKINFSKSEKDNYLYDLLVSYLSYAECLCLHTPIINLWNENNYKLNKKFFKDLDYYYDVDKECFKEIISATLESEGLYVISYMLSLELFYLYKQDKKRALELFKKLLRYPSNEDLLVFIYENFSFNNLKKEAELIINNQKSSLIKKKGLT